MMYLLSHEYALISRHTNPWHSLPNTALARAGKLQRDGTGDFYTLPQALDLNRCLFFLRNVNTQKEEGFRLFRISS